MERKITLVLTELISMEEIGEMYKTEIPDNSMITNILLHTAYLIASLKFCFHYYENDQRSKKTIFWLTWHLWLPILSQDIPFLFFKLYFIFKGQIYVDLIFSFKNILMIIFQMYRIKIAQAKFKKELNEECNNNKLLK